MDENKTKELSKVKKFRITLKTMGINSKEQLQTNDKFMDNLEQAGYQLVDVVDVNEAGESKVADYEMRVEIEVKDGFDLSKFEKFKIAIFVDSQIFTTFERWMVPNASKYSKEELVEKYENKMKKYGSGSSEHEIYKEVVNDLKAKIGDDAVTINMY